MLLLALLIAQATAPACPATPVSPPAALSAWGKIAAEPGIGKSFTLTAVDPATVRLSVPLNTRHPGKLALTKLHVESKGVYRVAIDAGAWIDLISGSTILDSVAHAHGPTCTGIRKTVDFTLAPGDYTLELTGLSVPTVKVLVVPVGK